VRRYAPGFSPILGFEDSASPDFGLLAAYCSPGESFYTDAWSGPAPDGWTIEAETTMFKMIWDAEWPTDEEPSGALELRPEYAQAALDLAILTNPGPFGIRTMELGDYFGVFDGSRLIAMAGERMWADSLREVSGVCTHPDFKGRGLGRKLVAKLVRNQLARNQVPFLHVMSGKESARALYKRMGFRDSLESVVRVVRFVGQP